MVRTERFQDVHFQSSVGEKALAFPVVAYRACVQCARTRTTNSRTLGLQRTNPTIGEDPIRVRIGRWAWNTLLCDAGFTDHAKPRPWLEDRSPGLHDCSQPEAISDQGQERDLRQQRLSCPARRARAGARALEFIAMPRFSRCSLHPRARQRRWLSGRAYPLRPETARRDAGFRQTSSSCPPTR